MKTSTRQYMLGVLPIVLACGCGAGAIVDEPEDAVDEAALAANGICEIAADGSASAEEGKKAAKRRAKAAAVSACAPGCDGDCLGDGAGCAQDSAGGWSCTACVYCEDVLAAVNRARRAAHACGALGSYGPSPPLTRSDGLQRYAYDWSARMADRRLLEHSATTGAALRAGFAAYGVSASGVGEAIAGGPVVPSATQVVDGWLRSPEHCRIVMFPGFTIAGVARAITGGGGSYFTLDVAAP
jgi:uncharacterized protein YkwD